ncbi:SusC/RagA family TonB-linked outer membrane protein [Ohtaekwangia sp.]|uniref:SusC/RagA family TonB-linked outer membrane protein n=1 Tax=Ohtaekwangia sp. TaxID=2066019 RepID=UPI002FDE73E3
MSIQYKFCDRLSLCLLLLLCSPLYAAVAQAPIFANAEVLEPEAQRKETRPLLEILDEVRHHFHVSFVYEPSTLEGKEVAAQINYNEKIESILNYVLGSAGLQFKKINRHTYSILPRQAQKRTHDAEVSAGELLPTLYGEFMSADEWNTVSDVIQDIAITGTITDDAGEPLPGVNVLIKGSSVGTTTDTEGKYSLMVPDQNTVLVISFIGYIQQEITVGNRTEINVSLAPDVKQLAEVVVVGYGTQKRYSVTGAVASVSSQDVAALPVPDVAAAIQGRVAGVSVVNNGSPGTAPIVRIRGVGSISYSADPLYVIDGIPSATNLSNFDTKDIESVEVLKDAAAAAIYGSRAANGVILITTKKGSRDNKPHVTIDSYYGVQSPWKKLDLLNRDEYVRYGTQLITNSGGTLPAHLVNLNEPIYAGATQTYAQTDTDWQDEMFRTSPITQSQVTLSTGNENLKLYTSAGYFKQDGIMLGTNFERYNYRLNTEFKLSKRFTFGQNLSLSSSATRGENQSGGRTQIQHIIHQVPYIPVMDPTKLGGYRAPDNNDGADPENPVRIAVQDLNKTYVTSVFGNAYLDVSIFDALKYRFTAGVNYAVTRIRTDLPIYNDGFSGRNNHQLTDNRGSSYSPIFSNQLTFDKTFGKHYLNAIAVAERQNFNDDGLNISANQSSNAINQLRGATNATINDGFRNERTLYSYLARVNYEYASKYLLSVSFRRDGYSAFAPGKKWGNFPGVSVGWRISEESFMKSVPTISELKVRASYGSIGFSGIGPYDWVSTIGLNTGYPFNNISPGVTGSFFDRLPNYNLEWEITKMTNIGLDIGVLDNRVTFSIEAYNRQVDNLILAVPLAPSLGYTQTYPANIGSMRNRGLEFQATYAKRTGDFHYTVSGNIGMTRNKVLHLDNPSSTIFAGNNADFGGFDITKTEGGHSIQGFYGWKTDGIFQSQEEINAANALDGNSTTAYQDKAAPGDIRFKDINGDGVINASDRTYLGSYIPNFNYGVNISVDYKNFDFSMFLQGVQGNKIYNGTKVLSQGMLRLFGADKAVLNAWRPDNTNTDIPRAISGDPNQNSRTSDRFIESGSYMRIKNISIGYTIPTTTLQSLTNGSLNKIRIYISAQNLVTITKYTGYDPEVGTRTNNNATPLLTNGVDYGQYPSARTLMAGLQIGF